MRKCFKLLPCRETRSSQNSDLFVRKIILVVSIDVSFREMMKFTV